VKPLADRSRLVQLLIYSGILLGSLVLFVSFQGEKPRTPSPEEEREAKRLEFCKFVINSIQPNDPYCGKYLSRLRQEIAADKAKAK
jgi:hypothetical protein